MFREKRAYQELNDMLDAAINGNFEETRYDESLLSQLSIKLKRYLSSSQISSQKVNEERLAIQETVSDISHQVKTPIANILLYGQLLEEHLTEERDKTLLQQMLSQTEKLNFLMQALVKTSRLETGVLKLVPIRQSLAPMIKSIIQQAKEKAQEKKMEILFSAAGNPWAVFDRKWTEEALFNILDNAVKYSAPETQITISITPYELFTAVSISDQGIGIPEREMAPIFTRFYRGEGVHDTEGVGIGLYLAREIIIREHGYIKAESEPGVGTCFHVFLPNS